MRQLLLLSCFFITTLVNAQKASINNVYKIYIKNTGAISEGDQIKGYYVFYQADKVDRKTNEYAIQILDQNTNFVKETKFTDSKEIELLDAEFNGTSLCFFFLNKDKDKKQFEYRIYDLDGKLKYTYAKPYDNGDLMLFETRRKAMGGSEEDGPSNSLIAVPNKGFITLLPARNNGSNYYEFGFYSSEKNSEWVYKPEVEERQVFTFYLSATDSVAYLELTKKKSALGGQPKSSIMALNFITKKQLFEIEDDQFDPAYKISALSMNKIEGSSNVQVLANYFDKDANVYKDFAKGIAFYTMDAKGKMVTKVYNAWQGDMSKYLSVNDKGKVEDLGFLSIQNMVKTPDGKLYAIAEGYKRNFDALGAAALLLSRGGQGSATKIVITDMVLLQFDNNLKIKSAKIYPKRQRIGLAGPGSDYYSQHVIAYNLKVGGYFDYEFTTSNSDKSAFAFCYTDYEKNDDYKGLVFNSLKYRDGKFSTDKIPLKTNASYLRILPAKAGFVTIVEYFKKEKRLDFRLEKIG